MKKFDEYTIEERKEICSYLETWLVMYNNEVINKVLDNIDDIINNEFVMNMLKQLHERTLKEKEDFKRNLRFKLENDIDSDFHNKCLTHSNSYRDVLYDMYIK